MNKFYMCICMKNPYLSMPHAWRYGPFSTPGTKKKLTQVQQYTTQHVISINIKLLTTRTMKWNAMMAICSNITIQNVHNNDNIDMS